MLGFPLEVPGVAGGTQTQRNDLEFYEPLYDPEVRTTFSRQLYLYTLSLIHI